MNLLRLKKLDTWQQSQCRPSNPPTGELHGGKRAHHEVKGPIVERLPNRTATLTLLLTLILTLIWWWSDMVVLPPIASERLYMAA